MKQDRSSIVIIVLVFVSTLLSRNAIIAYVPTTICRSNGNYFGKKRSHANLILIGGGNKQITIPDYTTTTRLYACGDDLQKIPFNLEYVDTELQYVCEQQYQRLHRTLQNTISNNEEDRSNNVFTITNKLSRKPRVFLLHNTVSSIQRRVRNPFVIGKRVFQRAFQSIFHDWELNEASIALLSRNFV